MPYSRNDKLLYGKPDFVIHSSHTAVFVHGCFWHQHRAKCNRAKVPSRNGQLWKAKLLANVRRDRSVTRRLRLVGWRVLNVWECSLASQETVSRRLTKLLAG